MIFTPAPREAPRPSRHPPEPQLPSSHACDQPSVPFPSVYSDRDHPFPSERPVSSLVMITAPALCWVLRPRFQICLLSWLLASALLCSGATDFSSAFSPHLSVLLCLWHSMSLSLSISPSATFSSFLVSFSVLLSILSLSPSLRETSQAQNVETKILW